MKNQTLTETQLGYLVQLQTLCEKMSEEEEESFKTLIDDADVFHACLEDVATDVERDIDILLYIKRYQNGETRDSGSIVVSNTLAVVVIEASSDIVFGFVPLEDGKQFFLSEVTYEYEDDNDEATPTFLIGEDGATFSLADAMRL